MTSCDYLADFSSDRVFDFHCDLLSYLAGCLASDAPFREASRCSLPLLNSGGVGVQTFAIFTETLSGSTKECQKQAKSYRNLFSEHSLWIEPFGKTGAREKIQAILAIENASALLEEKEPLSLLRSRLESLEPILYVSLTWNGENRFGGGCGTQVGLKEDGKVLLELLAEKKIAIDLSHASDHLSSDILDAIEKHSLSLLPIASHANFRSVISHPRNLSDEVAKAIFAKKGVIGINFVRHFLGPSLETILSHIEHGCSLGGEEALVFGADFFGDISFHVSSLPPPLFHPNLSNASHYPSLLTFLQSFISSQRLSQLKKQNGIAFLRRVGFFEKALQKGSDGGGMST